MKILIFCYEYPPVGGGGGQAAKFLAEKYSGTGNGVTVITGNLCNQTSYGQINGVTVIRVPTCRKRADRSTVREQLSYILSARKFVSLHKRELNPHIILSVFSIPSGLVGYPFAQALGVPHFIALQGGDVPGFQGHELAFYHRITMPITRRLWRGSYAVVANSEGLAALARATVPKVPIQVIPMGVDTSLFYPSALPHTPLHPLRCLFIGRLVEQKQPALLLDAFSSALKSYSGAGMELHIYGDGPLRQPLEAMARAKGISANVTFHGWIPFEQMPIVLRSGNIFTQTSKYEGMSAALLQAMASGLIPVAFRCHGQEMLKDGENALMSENGDVADLARNLIMLANDRNRLNEMSAATAATASRHSWDLIAGRYLELFENGLAAGKSSLLDNARRCEMITRVAERTADFSFRCRNTGPVSLAREFLSEERAAEQVSVLKRLHGAPLEGKSILEIGCGYGLFLLALRKWEKARAFGIEPGHDEYMGLKTVAALLEAGGVPGIVSRANGEHLSYQDNSFDIVYSSNVLEHVRDPASVLREAMRVLKPGGILVFIVPNYNSFWEGHYRLPWLPIFNWKPLGRLYVRLFGRDPAFLDTLTFVTPSKMQYWVRTACAGHHILGTGKEIWLERMQHADFGTWGGLEPLRKVIRILKVLGLARAAAHVMVALQAYTPMILVVEKSKGGQ